MGGNGCQLLVHRSVLVGVSVLGFTCAPACTDSPSDLDVGSEGTTTSTLETADPGSWSIEVCGQILAVLESLSGARQEIVDGDGGTHQALVLLADELEAQEAAFAELATVGPVEDQSSLVALLRDRTASAAQAYREVVERTSPDSFRSEGAEAVYEDVDASTTPPTELLVEEIRGLVMSPTFTDLSRSEQEAIDQERASGAQEPGSCETAARRLLSIHE